jgi:biopolymer transport protein ExbD
MSRRSRIATSSILNPNLTPLLDVVLQLITFFMMLVDFGTRLGDASYAVRLPVVSTASPSANLSDDRLAVSVDAEGRLLVGHDTLEAGAASAWWSEQARARRAALHTLGEDAGTPGEQLSTVVVILADRASP